MGRSIAVGVGGAGSWPALAWAADEAEQTGARLVLLHVCAPGSPLDRPTGRPTPAEVELVDPPLARAYAKTQTRLGGQWVALQIRSGEPSAALVDASIGVRLLIVGAGEGGRTVRRLLRHSHCPVVIVRPNSISSRGGPLAGHVVVGVDGTPAGQAATEFGFAYAAEHRLPLAAVHVSAADQDDYFYDDTTLSTHFAAEPAALKLLAAETEPWALKCPAVAVRRAVLHGSVADALIGAGAEARLLVIGDKRRGVIGRARTGDVPLTVATEARCPVAVVPLDQREGDPL
ncbi:universal stress protein [Winogradskya consettensis]|uniref:Universal stress protein n=1 Tax=Winogradskya consettensis TaxID=113560 RepID=A0A919VS35_9ACTN|nr:universal stress protein [Actinoplanes consettensis]GIM76734.1 universal stress protein [Actinoplanes consettensis]